MIATETNAIRRGDTMRHCVNRESTVNRSTMDNFRSTMVRSMGEVFDRIDSAVEREAAVELLCGDVDERTRERVASAILEYDRRRYVAAKRVLSGEWVGL